jgi:DNA-directed RNA polymerase specialized sigma24 family protein
MDKIYEFEEAEELARKAKNRLIVTKVAVEYLFIKDEYDKDEMSFVKAIEKTWQYLSTPQKYVLFMRTVQGLTFSSIAKTEGYSTQNAHKLFERACKVIRENM